MIRTELKPFLNQRVIVKGTITRINVNTISYLLENVTVSYYGTTNYITIDHIWVYFENDFPNKYKLKDIFVYLGEVHQYFRKSINDFDYGIKFIKNRQEEDHGLFVFIEAMELLSKTYIDIYEFLDKTPMNKIPKSYLHKLKGLAKKAEQALIHDVHELDNKRFKTNEFLNYVRLKVRKKEIVLPPGDHLEEFMQLDFKNMINLIDHLQRQYQNLVRFTQYLKSINTTSKYSLKFKPAKTKTAKGF